MGRPSCRLLPKITPAMTTAELHFLVIEGNIGVGKTSLARKLAQDHNARLLLEQFSDNPFLPKFYKEPTKYAFTLEMSFLTERYQQLMHGFDHRDMFRNLLIGDYYFMKSLIFARTNLNDDEYELYRKVFGIMYERLPRPDLYVYLHAGAARLLGNIQKRGRGYEQDIEASYLKNIQDSYFRFFQQSPELRILVIDVSGLDFIDNPVDYNRLKGIIFGDDYPTGITRIIPDESNNL